LGFFGARAYPPVQPHIQVAAENLTHHPLFSLPVLGDVYLTNTLVATVLTDLLVLLIVFAVQRTVRSGSLIPKGITGAVEMLMETLYGMTESSAGVRYARMIFPYFFIITFYVLIANWTKLLPGYETIGLLHHAEHGAPVQELAPGVYTLVQGEAAAGQGYGVIGFLRGMPTDLNFTVALALFSVVMTQVIGFKTQGFIYVSKFFNVLHIFSKPGFGVMDFLVGLLELISELAKVLSFSFRLFGNMFAGLVLLILIGSMIPVFLQSGVLLFELFIGAIQAFVFGMLTMVFMAQATQGHGGAEADH
jgi:F-type H+-transporting ATPase subunit a